MIRDEDLYWEADRTGYVWYLKKRMASSGYNPILGHVRRQSVEGLITYRGAHYGDSVLIRVFDDLTTARTWVQTLERLRGLT